MVILFTNKNWASVKTWSVKDLPNAAGTNPGKDQQNLHCLLHRPWLLIPRTVPRPPAVIQRTLTAAVSRPTSLSAPSEDISSLLDIWSEDMSLLERVQERVSVWGSGRWVWNMKLERERSLWMLNMSVMKCGHYVHRTVDIYLKHALLVRLQVVAGALPEVSGCRPCRQKQKLPVWWTSLTCIL